MYPFEVYTDGARAAYKKVNSTQEVFDFMKENDFFPCKQFLIIVWDLGGSCCAGITRDKKGRYVKVDGKKLNKPYINKGNGINSLLRDLLGLFNAAI